MAKMKFMGELRQPKSKDFVGKTIKSFRRHTTNQWRFTFTDGSELAINAETYSVGSIGSLPALEVIDK